VSKEEENPQRAEMIGERPTGEKQSTPLDKLKLANRREKALGEAEASKLLDLLEGVVNQLGIGVTMLQLMVLQLDGRVEISNETMRLYVEALSGGKRALSNFRKHVLTYFREEEE